MRLITTCVDAKADDINDMVDSSREIKYEIFAKHVPYDLYSQFCFPELHVKDDYSVRWYSSMYKNKKVFYMVHSSIEYVFGE